MKSLSAFFAALFIVSGCGKTTTDSAPVTPKPASSTSVSSSAVDSVAKVASAPTPVSAPTMDDWKQALLSTYKESDVKNKGDGVTEFVAVFDFGQKYKTVAFGTRDGFRKLRFYVPGINSSIDIGTTLKSYLSIPDGKLPILFLQPYYFEKHGWLFMNQVSIMVDGDVVLDHKIAEQSVKRNVEDYGVEERANFVVSPQEMDALRKIKPSSTLLIRFTGTKGYVNVSKRDAANVQRELIDDVAMYDRLLGALKDKVPAG